jgi:transcriptional regulator with PAS, ATPase and Fis domain
MESDLFGHERGSFTGAVQAQKGKFEIANGGTIFFDEIGDLPLSLQPKLLRVLEDQIVIRIGSANPIHVDVRMIFATGKDLKEMIAQGKFREDLFYRINVVPVTLPPLRERSEDIPALITYFQSMYEQKYNKKGIKIPSHVYKCLLDYDYPGNVRELRNIVERAVLLSFDENIHEDSLPSAIRETTCKMLKGTEEDSLPLEEGIKAYERQRIIKALTENNGRKIKAAEQLGISRKVLWKKMKDLNIDQTNYGC